MAAIALPLAAAVLPEIVPLLVRLADKLLGSKTGPAKLGLVTTVAKVFADHMAAANGAAPPAPTSAEIATIVQAAWASLQGAGELKGTATQVFPPALPAATPPNVLDAMDGLRMMMAGFLKTVAAQATLG